MKKQPIAMHTFLLYLLLGVVISWSGCQTPTPTKQVCATDTLSTSPRYDSICARKELRVITLYSATSYFIYRGVKMGFDYEMARNFAISQGWTLRMVVAENQERMEQMLTQGEGDLIAYTLPITQESRENLLFCGLESESHQVLVQRRYKEAELVTDVTQLVGKEIYVEPHSRYEERLQNLNDELGGGIQIGHVAQDTLNTDDLIRMVARGEIPYTLADNTLAQFNKTYYNNLDISLQVSFPQRSSWAVSRDNGMLAEQLNRWLATKEQLATYSSITKRYFENSKYPKGVKLLSAEQGKISHYDSLFKKYAPHLGWDWRLLASQAFQESTFNATAISWSGAQGLMQLMPSTAEAMKLSPDSLCDPEANLRAAVRYIRQMERGLTRVTDPEEQKKFVLAAYNAGLGHVYDAMALAEKYNHNPYLWDDNVAEFILLKKYPEYYNDPLCKHGYLRGRETYNYVQQILYHYEEYCEKIPQ